VGQCNLNSRAEGEEEARNEEKPIEKRKGKKCLRCWGGRNLCGETVNSKKTGRVAGPGGKKIPNSEKSRVKRDIP